MGIQNEIKLIRKKAGCLREEIMICRRVAGLRGILAISANLVLGCPAQVAVSDKELEFPLFLRLRTSDAKTYEEVILGREYDYPLPFSPRTIEDVGANCGMTSIFYANRYPDAKVIALEPEESNYKALVRNTAAYSNIVAMHAALWNADGQVEVFPAWPRFRSWGKWGFRVREGKGCRSVTLPTLMREVGMDVVDVLKIDVEGAEQEIFFGCDWMDRVKLLAIELHDRDRRGCSETVDAAAKTHRKFQRGLVTFYVRNGSTNAA